MREPGADAESCAPLIVVRRLIVEDGGRPGTGHAARIGDDKRRSCLAFLPPHQVFGAGPGLIAIAWIACAQRALQPAAPAAHGAGARSAGAAGVAATAAAVIGHAEAVDDGGAGRDEGRGRRDEPVVLGHGLRRFLFVARPQQRLDLADLGARTVAGGTPGMTRKDAAGGCATGSSGVGWLRLTVGPLATAAGTPLPFADADFHFNGSWAPELLASQPRATHNPLLINAFIVPLRGREIGSPAIVRLPTASCRAQFHHARKHLLANSPDISSSLTPA